MRGERGRGFFEDCVWGFVLFVLFDRGNKGEERWSESKSGRAS